MIKNFYNVDNKKKLVAKISDLNKCQTYEEIKNLLNDAFVGENEKIAVFNVVTRRKLVPYLILLINKDKIDEQKWVYQPIKMEINDNLKITDNTVIINNSTLFYVDDNNEIQFRY